MDSEEQLTVSHLLASPLDVPQYTTLHHSVESYAGILTPGNGTPEGSTVPSSTTITLNVPQYTTLDHSVQAYAGTPTPINGTPEGSTVPSSNTITLGYCISHPGQCTAGQPYTVTLTPQVTSHPHIHYYCETADPIASLLQVTYNTADVLGLPAAGFPQDTPPSPVPSSEVNSATLDHQPRGNEAPGGTLDHHILGNDTPGGTIAHEPQGNDPPCATLAQHPQGNNTPGSTIAHEPQGNEAPGATLAQHPQGNNTPGSTIAHEPQGNEAPGGTLAQHPQRNNTPGGTITHEPQGNEALGGTLLLQPQGSETQLDTLPHHPEGNKAPGGTLAHQPQRKEAQFDTIPNQPQDNTTTAKRRARGREGTSAKLRRKQCRNRGEAYISSSGKLVSAKKYVDQDCKCHNKCLAKLGTLGDREAIFRHFWDIGDFAKQNSYLSKCVVMVPSAGGAAAAAANKKEGDTLDDKNLRTVKRMYYVKLQESQDKVRVCKSHFLRLHGVSNGRLDRVLQAIHCQHPHALQDRRGRHSPSNKTAQKDLEMVEQHIREMQHCSKGTTAAGKVSVREMHELYRQKCVEEGRTHVSLWVYKKVETRLRQQEGCNGEDKMCNSVSHTLVPSQCHRNDTVSTALMKPVNSAILNTQLSSITNTNTAPVTGTPITTTTTTTNTTFITIIPTITTSTTTYESGTLHTITTTTNTASVTGTPITTTATNTTSITTIPTATTATTTTPTTIAPTTSLTKRTSCGTVPMTRKERKSCRNKGEAYITAAGKIQGRKVYRDVPCECRQKCIPSLGTPEARQLVFHTFWSLASFTRQNAYIADVVTLAPLTRRQTAATLCRTFSRVYRVPLKTHSFAAGKLFLLISSGSVNTLRMKGKQKTSQSSSCIFTEGGELVGVCKQAFLTLHGVSNGRLDRVLQAVGSQSPFALKDRRGCHIPTNKTQEEAVSHAWSHMCTFPVGALGGVFQLPQWLSIQGMYRLYRDKCVVDGRKPVGSFVYRNILKEKFNYPARAPSKEAPEKLNGSITEGEKK